MKAWYHLFIPKGEDSGIGRMLFHEQMRAYEESGLSEVCPLTIGVIGTEYWRDRLIRSSEDHFRQYPFIERVIEHDMSENDDNLYEGATLRPLWEYCRFQHNEGWDAPREPILYLHSKGAVTMNRHTNNHRLYMEHYILRQWREAVRRIEEGYSICGVDWRNNGWWHFSGNFWWASSDYIAKLPDPRMVCEGNPPGAFYVDDSRVKMEMWVGSGVAQGLNPRVAVLHDSGIHDWYRASLAKRQYDRSGFHLSEAEESWLQDRLGQKGG